VFCVIDAGLMMHGSNSTYLCSRCQKGESRIKTFQSVNDFPSGEPPVVISLPNFLYAPDYVQQSIDGIRRPPEQELDQIEVDIEPRLGTIVQAHRRFLINFSMWKGVNLTMPYVDLGLLASIYRPPFASQFSFRFNCASFLLTN
jgi:hypothetical protein